MAIQFQCPACSQPIEIEEQWGGQSVACPYCRRVITAPASSTWPPAEIPMAVPAGAVDQPPPASLVTADDALRPPPQRRSAVWAFTLAVTSAVLCVLAWAVLMFAMIELAVRVAGPNASEEQVRQALQQAIADGRFPRPALVSAALVVGTFCGLGGLVLAVRCLLWQEGRRGLAIAACVISSAFLFCQLPAMMAMLISAPAAR